MTRTIPNSNSIIIMGSNEIEKKEAVVKNLKAGVQQIIPLDQLVKFFNH